jgi:Methyltransferase domain
MARLRSYIDSQRWRLLKRSFDFWQRRGIHVLPVHFYEPVPDTRTLKPSLWQSARELVGIDLRGAEQLRLLERFAERFRHEYERFPVEPAGGPHEYYENNGQFQSTDGEILHCMIRAHRPRHVIEIGSGFSSRITAQALLLNVQEGGHAGELICIEPFPSESLRAGFPGLTRLITEPVQDVPLAFFELLEADDVLFIDSSHVVKIGSDTTVEILDILPRLKPGVLVHIHDIYVPFEYPPSWVLDEHRFWNEQYLVEAFLSFNDRFRILYAGSWLHLFHAQKLTEFSALYQPARRWSTSLWIQRVA